MKKKVIALTLSAVLALSSTSAFAAETTNCTKTNFDFNSLLKNYTSKCANTKSQYKLTLNGKTVDLNSADLSTIFNANAWKTSVTQLKSTKPVATQQTATKPVATKPVVTQPAAPKDTTSNTTVSSSNLTYEQKVVELVNIERQKNGLSALALNSSISNVARTKSKDMASNNYFAHQSPTYGSAGDMLKQFGILWSAWGENIASGQRTPEAVVTAWMNSEGHRANILSSNFSKIGVGYATNSNGTPYWTQMFTN